MSAIAPLNYKNVTVNHATPYVGERGIIYALHISIQGTHHVYVQRLLQNRHTLCSYQRMA